MSNNERQLNFGFSYNELVSLSFEKETFLNKSLADLTSRGITAIRLKAFADLRETFVTIPSDDVMLAKITIAKNARDAIAEPLRIAIREVQGIAGNTFGKGSAQHKTFVPQTLSDMDAEGLYMLASIIVGQATTFTTEMTPHGLTAAMLTNITTIANNLKPKIKDFSDAEANQLLSTQNRHNAANALYDEMSAMCNAAVVYYQDRNPLKASLFVIYDEVGNAQQRNGSVLPETTITRKFDSINAESKFKLKAFEGNDLISFFSNSEAGAMGTKSVSIINNAVDFKIVTAADLGYNATTGYVYFCIKNNGSKETGYRVVME